LNSKGIYFHGSRPVLGSAIRQAGVGKEEKEEKEEKKEKEKPSSTPRHPT
jgi:hypothetical protein